MTHPPMPTLRSLLCASALALATAPAGAQVVTLDEGAFVISRGRQPVGREQFSIRRPPRTDGVSFVASATVVYEENARRLSPALSTDSLGAAVAYQVETRQSGETTERLSGTVGRGRFSARSQTPRGESAREYVVNGGALVLDDGIFHQYYFLGLGGRSGPVSVIEPRRNAQMVLRVQLVGEETLDVGGTPVRARHFVLTSAAEPERHVWLDASSRVLKVTIPAKSVEAIREEPPK